MKIRTDYVTNSSSSSFIVLVDVSKTHCISAEDFFSLLGDDEYGDDRLDIRDVESMKRKVQDKAFEFKSLKIPGNASDIPADVREYRIADLEREIGNMNLILEQAEATGLEVAEFRISYHSALRGVLDQLIYDGVFQVLHKDEH